MAIDISPRFTVSLRGYDKDEVDTYLESMSERTTQADDQLYELTEQARFLEAEHERLCDRVEELESAIRSETPHTVGALGERITLILNQAEEGASDTITQAKAEAEYIVGEAKREADALRRQATADAAQATDMLAGAQRQAAELAERLEAEAKVRAAAVLGDAELRAQRRQEQIESWAQEVITRTQAEQARLAEEFAVIRRRHEAEVRSLLGERDDAVAALRSLQTSLQRAVDRVPVGRPTRPLDAPVAASVTVTNPGPDVAPARPGPFAGATTATGDSSGLPASGDPAGRPDGDAPAGPQPTVTG
jgi:cell division septum initiation protein DivIVA